MNSLTGKVAIVTGASKGIGAAIAKQLADEGAAVVVNYASSKAGADRVVAEITGKGGRAVAVQADVAKQADVRRLFAEAQRAFGRLDVLINNAGVYPDQGLTILTLPRDRLDQTFQTNTFGPLEVTQAFLPYLRKAGAARIINVSSGYGQLDGLSADVPSYCLSKLALNSAKVKISDSPCGP